MLYFLIGIIICFIAMKYYDWPSKNDPASDYFPALMWGCFIVLFWPIVLGVWFCGAVLQYFSKDGG